jgi:hypothetical protein
VLEASGIDCVEATYIAKHGSESILTSTARHRVPVCRREVFEDFCPAIFSFAPPISSGFVADSASRARRNTRSLAVFVRSACARCSYSGIELWLPDDRSCLKRSSASSLDVIEISIVLNRVTRSAEYGVCVRQRHVTRIVPKRRCPVRWKPAEELYSGFTAFGVRRQS